MIAQTEVGDEHQIETMNQLTLTLLILAMRMNTMERGKVYPI
jgi:hypothetical protein